MDVALTPDLTASHAHARGAPACEAARAMPFEALYREHRGMVTAVVRNVLGADDELEDVVQTAFLEVHRSLERFRGDAALSTWIYRVATNTALQALRRQRRRRWLRLFTEPDDLHRVEAPPTPDRAQTAGALAALDAALAPLSPKKRAVYVLVEIEGLSPAEVAEVLDVKVNTVRSRLIAARAEVTERLRAGGWLDAN